MHNPAAAEAGEALKPTAPPLELQESGNTLSYSKGIPEAVRQYGWTLAPNMLEPGDLLLVCEKNPTWVSGCIQREQGKLYEDAHARWHHAAVCGGGVEICEATLHGVVAQQYWGYMTGEHELRVRRLKNATPTERAMVAYFAAARAKTRYGFATILSILGTFNMRNPWRRSLFQSKGVICSQLYFEACMRKGFYLMELLPDQISPAHLSASEQMDDLDVPWVPVTPQRAALQEPVVTPDSPAATEPYSRV